MNMLDKFVIGALKRRLQKFKKKGMIHVPTDIPRISPHELMTGDILKYFYGNKVTEFHGKYRRSELGRLDLVPFHSGMFYEHSKRQDYIVDPELRTTASLLTEYTHKSSYRIEIIRYPITDEEREALYQFATKAIEEERVYDVWGYGSFISDLPGLGWTEKLIDKVSWLQPSKDNFFCSDFDASAYAECVKSCKITSRPPNKTAPVDILRYALKSRKAKRFLLKDRGETL